MASPILVTGAAGRVGAIGRTVTELLLMLAGPRTLSVQEFVRNNAATFTAQAPMVASV